MELWSLSSSSVSRIQDKLKNMSKCRLETESTLKEHRKGEGLSFSLGPRPARIWETTEAESGLAHTWHTTLVSCFWPSIS